MTPEMLNSHNREIRVADLLSKSHCRLSPDSGPSSPTIQISLRRVSLNDSPPPEYTALSYVWGDPKDTIPIVVDGVKFAATKNLVSALRELQHDEEIVTLWVDAVCINQSDNDEKSGQIQLMKQIFEAAACTVVWLGDEADGSDAIMKMVADFAARPDFQAAIAESASGTQTADATDEGKNILWMMFSDPSIPTHGSHPAFLSTQASLAALLSREYWFRVWCLQEILVCRNAVVVCGSNGYRIDVDLFGITVYWYLQLMKMIVSMATAEFDLLDMIETDSPYLPEKIAKEVNGGMAMFQRRVKYRDAQLEAQREKHEGGEHNRVITGDSGASHPDLLWFLIDAYTNIHINMSLRSTDPRDTIYGLFNLAYDVKELGIVPDYNKTCEQVFLETWLALLRKHGAGLLVLAAPSGTQEGQVLVNGPLVALPSWVPDWRHPRPSHILQEGDFFLACGPEHQDTQWVNTALEDPGSIALKGVRVDIVQRIGTAIDREDPLSLPHTKVLIDEVTRFLEESSSSSPPIYATPESIHSARWRIPVCDLDATPGPQIPRRIARATIASEEGFHSVMAVMGHTAPETDEGVTQLFMTMDKHFPSLVAYIWMAVIRTPFSRPFLTARGWVGRGPTGMREGDIIVILWGSRIPLVLRPCGDGGEGKYQLVGDAYVHGLMDGEFLQYGAVREEEVFCLV